MLLQILTQNGFSDKEAQLYLAVLRAGEMTFSRAAEKSNLKRSTVYNLVEKLKERGIISTIKKNGVCFVSALSPKLLIEHFERNASQAKSALPQLLDLAYASPIKPRIYFYEHTQGIKDILFEAANSKQDYIGFIDYTLMPKEVYTYIQKKIAPERAKNGTHLRLLMPRNQTNERTITEYTQNVEHQMVDFPSRKNHIEILLYGTSKIGFMSFVKNEMFGVVIDSEAIYQTLYDLFTVIWKNKNDL